MTLSAKELRLRRAGAQLLDGPARTDVVASLLAVQAQDVTAAGLALRARSGAVLEHAHVVGWLMRGTLHLVRKEDYRWLLALTAPTRLAGNRRRLGQEGVPADHAERAVEIIERSLADEGPLTRPELAERIAARGIRTEGQATPHLLALASFRGVCVLEPSARRFVLASDWLGPSPAEPEPDSALAELARRYLRGHGPATDADLAAWSGLPLRDVRTGLKAIAIELEELDGGLLDLRKRRKAPTEIEPRLLPAFDPYMLGWKDRTFAVPQEHLKKVHPGGGMIRAVAIDRTAAVVGTWTSPRDPKVELFA